MSTRRWPPNDAHRKRTLQPERSAFTRFAKKLISVPKKEIDQKAKKWERDKGKAD